MKPDFNRKYNTIAIYAVLVVAVSAVVVAAIINFPKIWAYLGNFVSLLTPFIIGFVLAYILCPILNAIERLLARLTGERLRRGTRRVICLILTYIVTIIVLTIFFWIVIPQIVSSVTSIAVQIPGWMTSVEAFANDIIAKYDLYNLPTSTLQQIMKAFEQVLSSVTGVLTDAIPHVWKATLSVTTGVLNFILGIIISIYMLLSKERFFAQIKKLMNALIPSPVVQKILDITHQSHEIFSGFISGKLLDSLIIGVLCFCGMNLFQMPYAMLISVIVGVTNIIPYFGPFIGAIPSILILLMVEPVTALWFALFVLLLQQLDGNVIGPKILGDSTGLSAFWVVFSITVFGSLLGLVGMFIGVPLFAVIYSLIRQFAEWRLEKKGLPISTGAFASKKHPLIEGKPPKKPKSKK
ncbi:MULTISPECIES: AI-2E family transporter [Oscillospiraceae]|uniref:PurR-regulated permease PerM n=1 Tax=Harryflintia acetispora TaxID=1849041 RepID=A0A9X8Y7P5_9FIRM|nr:MULTISPECIES: AI-2E family transporter [Oscillospiraceae]RGB65032.1 AI-2E family transporter [Harryflintia acetispora]TCL42552.1 putative PurR-regulated permease PerM [Harryflintia acetispora]